MVNKLRLESCYRDDLNLKDYGVSMNLSFESLISYISDFFESKLLFFWFMVLFIITSIFYIKIKAGSAFFIVNKFAMIFMRKKSTDDNELIKEIIEIEAFNFQYNTKAVSIRQKKKFESWIRKYELDFRMITKLKGNLNIETLKVMKIKKQKIVIWAIVAITIFLSLSKTLELAVKPAGLIKIENSGWFWFNKEQAENYSFWGKSGNIWKITPKECNEISHREINLSDDVKNTVCSSFNDKQSLTYIKGLIKKQRYFFGGLVGLSLIVFFYILSFVLSLVITYDIRKMIFGKIKKYRKERYYKK